jgi:beta-glucanase (GH16 family)
MIKPFITKSRYFVFLLISMTSITMASAKGRGYACVARDGGKTLTSMSVSNRSARDLQIVSDKRSGLKHLGHAMNRNELREVRKGGLTTSGADPAQPDGTAPEKELGGMKLVWDDEFNGTGSPDRAKWRFETGFQRNHEDQWYQESNAYLDGKGNLVIEGRKERVLNPDYQPGSSDWKKSREYAEYTSASLQSKYTYRYGKVIVRAKIPVTGGSWPAIWQVGNAWEWPLGGEIDIMEYYPVKGHPAIHANYCWGTDRKWAGHWQSVARPLASFIERDKDWVKEYHIWTLDWNKRVLKISVDGELINEVNTSRTFNGSNGSPLAGAHQNPFSNSINGFGDLIWLNLALGGDNGGKIDDSAFPVRYDIDYVRVYR